MLSVPKHGEILIENEQWLFRKHGLGVRFYHPSGRVVDVHRFYEDVHDAIDAWRVLQLAENMGMPSITEQGVENALLSLVLSGALHKTEHVGVYCLGTKGMEAIDSIP